MQDSEFKIVKQYDRSWSVKIAAGIFITIGLLLLYFLILSFVDKSINWAKYFGFSRWNKGFESVFFFFFIFLQFGFNLAKRNRVIFDLEKKRYKIEEFVGPIHWGDWETFSNLKRVSIFKNNHDFYELNIWFLNNKHFTFDIFTEYEDVLAEAQYVAKILELEILDASDPRNPILLDSENN